MENFGGKVKTTLCWTCQRAVRLEIEGIRCPWSHDFKPVPGWDAEFNRRRTGTNPGGVAAYMETYHVRSCPLYLKDKPQKSNNEWLKGGL